MPSPGFLADRDCLQRSDSSSIGNSRRRAGIPCPRQRGKGRRCDSRSASAKRMMRGAWARPRSVGRAHLLRLEVARPTAGSSPSLSRKGQTPRPGRPRSSRSRRICSSRCSARVSTCRSGSEWNSLRTRPRGVQGPRPPPRRPRNEPAVSAWNPSEQTVTEVRTPRMSCFIPRCRDPLPQRMQAFYLYHHASEDSWNIRFLVPVPHPTPDGGSREQTWILAARKPSASR